MRVLLVILFSVSSLHAFASEGWDEILANGSGTVNVYYYEAEPFIYKNDIGELKGIEKDIMESFFRFLEKKYKVKIFRNWVKINDFDSLFHQVKDDENGFGISLISKTKKRESYVAFSSAYMPDVSVLISHISLPFLRDTSELKSIRNFEAATIGNTTYQEDLLALSQSYDLNLKLLNVLSEGDIVRLVSVNKDMVGYVGLPFYVIEIGKGNLVKRQGNFQIKRDGYRFIFNKDASWDEPVKKYFESYLYKAEADNIIRQYLGNDYSELIWGIAGSQNNSDNSTEIDFLNKEKELQSKSLYETQQIKDKQSLLILVVVIGFVLVTIIVILLISINKRKSKTNAVLLEKRKELEILLSQLNQQKDEIAYQRKLLQEKNKQLQNINQQKDDLIGLVAHDLKSPINQMSGLISLLGYKNENWDEEEKELYDKLMSSNKHLKELVERILDTEAIRDNSLNYRMAEVNMSSILNDVLSDFEEMAKHKSISIDTFGLKSEMNVYVDSFFLKQVFENLVSNSLKFSPKGSTVKISSEEQTEFYQIAIQDQGPGFSDSDKIRLFSKFQTLSAKPTGSESSTGLGLSIVKKYVEEMNGNVWAESEHENGATFYVAFKKV